MRETDRIRQQMHHAFNGGAWHGPSVFGVLEGVTAAIATAKPIPGAHSIWELVLHISATQQILLRRTRGEQAGTEAAEFWPSAPVGPEATDAAWATSLDALRRQQADLEAAVGDFDDAKLDDPIMPDWTSAYTNFHGHVQHSIWHASQIALLKRCSPQS